MNLSEDWITQAQAARLRGVSRQAINKLVKKGRIKSINVGSIILISKEEIKKFKPLGSGRPKKSQNG
ncbi:MAG: helix-turn-helix domain-containing protein [Cyclobacteriaceae bacterium]